MRKFLIVAAVSVAGLALSCSSGGGGSSRKKPASPPWWFGMGQASISHDFQILVFDRVVDNSPEGAGCGQSVSVVTLDHAAPELSQWVLSFTWPCGDCDATWIPCSAGTWGPGGLNRPTMLLRYLGTPADSWTADVDLTLTVTQLADRNDEGAMTVATFSGMATSSSLPTQTVLISGSFEAVRVIP
ncbi:MAG: hypothetical protein O7H41_14385 [Planctomycetota bacterium]|nr:hypothetical protein [Planctomycetota bacterium]